MRRLLLAFAFICLANSTVFAQNTTCATRPIGDNSNACASTAFVQNAAANPPPGFTINNPLTGFFFAESGARIQRLADRLFVGGAVLNAGTNVLSQPDWLTQFQISTGRGGGFMQYAQGAILTDNGSAASQNAFITAAQTRYITGAGNAIAGIDIGVNNNTSISTGAFGRYIEVYRLLGVTGGAAGLEIDTANYASLVNLDPFQQNAGQTVALQIAAGAELSSTGQFPASAAINIQYNNATFAKALNVGANSINGTNGIDGNVVAAVTMATGHAIKYYYGIGNVNWTLSAGIGVNGNYNFTTTGTGVVAVPGLLASSLSVTGSASMPGLLHVTDLATTSQSTTVNGQVCALAGVCTVTATAANTLTFGTHLTSGGASYNGSAAVTITSDATNANTASTIVARDGSGNFIAGTITASLTGHASLDLALTGGTMFGAIAMGTNNITGVGNLAATTINGNTFTTGTGVLTIATAKTLTISNTLTATGTDGSSIAFGTGGTVLYNGGALGTPSSGVATNLTGTASGLTAGNVTTNANLTGDVTSVGNATTLTNAPVIAKVLTGFVSGSGTVSATDSILSAFQKINGNDALKAPIASPIFTGTVTMPTFILPTTGSAPTFQCFTSGGTCAGFWFADAGHTTANQIFFGSDGTTSNLFRVGFFGTGGSGTNSFGFSGATGSVYLNVGGSVGVNATAYNVAPSNTLYVNGSSSFNTTSTTGTAINSSGTVFMASLSADTATTDRTLCQNTSTNQIMTGTGTLGICLGTSGHQFKTDFTPLTIGVDDLMKIDFQNFRYRNGYGDDGARLQYGTTAQNIEGAIPDLVRYDATGTPINYDSGALLFIGLHAIQQVKAEINELKGNRR